MLIWNVITAIGTVAAAMAGILGIWINHKEKKKRLNVSYNYVPRIELFISNNSKRSVAITKLLVEIKDHIVYVKYFTADQQLIIPPASTECIPINCEAIKAEYKKHNMNALCSREDKIEFILYDNYKRRYRIKTILTIDSIF